MAESFRVGVTRDFVRPDGSLGFGGHGVRLLEETPGLEWAYLPEHGKELRPEEIAASMPWRSGTARQRRDVAGQ